MLRCCPPPPSRPQASIAHVVDRVLVPYDLLAPPPGVQTWGTLAELLVIRNLTTSLVSAAAGRPCVALCGHAGRGPGTQSTSRGGPPGAPQQDDEAAGGGGVWCSDVSAGWYHSGQATMAGYHGGLSAMPAWPKGGQGYVPQTWQGTGRRPGWACEQTNRTGFQQTRGSSLANSSGSFHEGKGSLRMPGASQGRTGLAERMQRTLHKI